MVTILFTGVVLSMDLSPPTGACPPSRMILVLDFSQLDQVPTDKHYQQMLATQQYRSAIQ